MNTGSQRSTKEKPIVLVVDGDIGRRYRTSVYLMRLEHHVFSVGSAEEALAVAGANVPGIVITELHLPRMNGLELLRRLKQDARTGKAPVLIYTPIKDDAYRKLCEQAGCAGYLVQTGDENELYQAVQKATEPSPRNFVRLSTWLDAVISGPTGNYAGLIMAVSEQGMFVNMATPLSKGTTAEFTFALPKAFGGQITLSGKVLYSHAGSGGKMMGIGVKFLDIPPESNQLLTTFIREHLLRGISPKQTP